MRKSKPAEQRVVNAGVSLPPTVIKQVRDAAQREGFETLTSLVRYLLTQWLWQTEIKWDTVKAMHKDEAGRIADYHRALAADSRKNARKHIKP